MDKKAIKITPRAELLISLIEIMRKTGANFEEAMDMVTAELSLKGQVCEFCSDAAILAKSKNVFKGGEYFNTSYEALLLLLSQEDPDVLRKIEEVLAGTARLIYDKQWVSLEHVLYHFVLKGSGPGVHQFIREIIGGELEYEVLDFSELKN